MTANLPAERKPQVAAGGHVAAIVPQSLDEAYRLAGALSASGLTPKGFERPEQVMVAIMAGAELGLAPYQALQSFAVVNGRATMWGDSLVAVVRAQGCRIKTFYENEDAVFSDAMTAVCEVTRPDGEVVRGLFSVADAKRAKLWGKVGRSGEPTPWVTYPKRMLMNRARAYALRDGCADMLRGVQVREEVEDYDQVRTVSGPRASGLRDRLTGPTTDEGFTAANAPADPVAFAEHAEEIAEAEFSEPVAEEAAAPEGSVTQEAADEADSFPGDREPGGFGQPAADDPTDDIAAWAQRTKDELEEGAFATVAAMDAFTTDPATIEKFLALEAAHPTVARSLDATFRAKRKALASVGR